MSLSELLIDDEIKNVTAIYRSDVDQHAQQHLVGRY